MYYQNLCGNLTPFCWENPYNWSNNLVAGPPAFCRHHKPATLQLEKMRKWKHSGFSVDTSVRIEASDKKGMMRLIQYIIHCPFSLERMAKVTADGKVIYRAVKGVCHAFPKQGDPNLKCGTKRNFEVFEPLDFLAEVPQHIPKHGQHQFWLYPRAYLQQRKQVFCFSNMADILTRRWEWEEVGRSKGWVW